MASLRIKLDILLIFSGGVFPQTFIKPPSRIGTYCTSTCLKAFEFCTNASISTALHLYVSNVLQPIPPPRQTHLEDVESNVGKRAHNVHVECNLRLRHDRLSLESESVGAVVGIRQGVRLCSWHHALCM